MRKIPTLVAWSLVVCGSFAHAVADQEAVLKVKALYSAAAYEDALAVMSAIPPETRTPELDHYRVFCYIALGDTVQAQNAIETVLGHTPLYEPDAGEISPRVIEAFREMRQRVLPGLAKRLYMEGKTALERKERTVAIERFDTLLRLMKMSPTSAAVFDDMRVVAEGFLDLSRALPEAPPASRPEPAVTRGDSPSAAAAAPALTRPVAIKQELPRWNAPDAPSRRSAYDGILRVKVSADGKVEAAEIVKRTHPNYDGLLVNAAQGWLYEPARRNGVPVAAEILVEVRLRPQD